MTAAERKLVREAVNLGLHFAMSDNVGASSEERRHIREALAILDAEDAEPCPKCKGGGTLWAGLGTHRMPCGNCHGTGRTEGGV